MLIFLLAIIALGVLVSSEAGQEILGLLILLAIAAAGLGAVALVLGLIIAAFS